MSPAELAAPSRRSRTVLLAVRLLHAIWAALGVAVSAWLLSSWRGHPPGVIFLPVALAVWGLGHLFLWGSGRLARAGARRLEARGLMTGWPPALVLAIAGTGLIAAAGLVLVGRLVVERDLGLDA